MNEHDLRDHYDFYVEGETYEGNNPLSYDEWVFNYKDALIALMAAQSNE